MLHSFLDFDVLVLLVMICGVVGGRYYNWPRTSDAGNYDDEQDEREHNERPDKGIVWTLAGSVRQLEVEVVGHLHTLSEDHEAC